VKLGDAEEKLPNALHDAELLQFWVDYKTRTAKFEFNAWVGDLSSKDEADREKYQKATLLIRGLRFLILEKPDPRYTFQSGIPMIGGFSGWGGEYNPASEISKLVEQLPDTAFYEATFVQDWNSFIHIAADDAEIELVDE
jgi:hypothetical protein